MFNRIFRRRPLPGSLEGGCGYTQRALRQIERMPQRDLEDIGFTRAELITLVFGAKDGRCAEF